DLEQWLRGDYAVSGITLNWFFALRIVAVPLVLCGGGARGVMEVGFYQALVELQIPINKMIGSSVGALNGAFIAAGMPPEKLAELWCGVRRRNLTKLNWKGLLHPRRLTGLWSLEPLRQLLEETLPVFTFEELVLPFTITTTDIQTTQAVYWSGSGNLVDPVLASMSIPGLFSPVVIGGRQYVDGAIANNVPLDQTLAQGARTALFALCTCCTPAAMPVSGLVNVLTRSFMAALNVKYQSDVRHYQSQLDLHVIESRYGREVGLLDFTHTRELIAAGYHETLEYFSKLNLNTAANNRPTPLPETTVDNCVSQV
ncbi:MAG: patatin-like phospholipase family protein, partial [Gammaproteobacteria bacterium]|nr:patatin-like phospholipase family protein [Gammaproteobacteria bacterium]